MASTYNEPITMDTDWGGDESTGGKPVKGARVQEAIKHEFRTKIGFMERSAQTLDDNCYHLLGFANEDARNEYMESGDPGLLLANIQLPEGGSGGAGGGTTNILTLESDSNRTLISTDSKVKLLMRLTSVIYNPLLQSTTDTGENAVVTIQTRSSANGAWSVRGTQIIASVPYGSTQAKEVDLSGFLSQGWQQVRLVAKGADTELNSNPITFEITVANISIANRTNWARPVRDNVLRLSYNIGGAIDKRLHIMVDSVERVNTSLGSAEYLGESVYQCDIRGLAHGVHDVVAWVEAGDAATGIFESGRVRMQILWVDPESTDANYYLLMENPMSQMTNWTTNTVMQYAAVCADTSVTTIPVRLTLEGEGYTYSNLNLGDIPTAEPQELVLTLEIDSSTDVIDAQLKFNLAGRIFSHPVTVNNSGGFAPVKGAVFAINPRLHTNDDADPQRIWNDASAIETIVPSTWSGFGMRRDGWTVDTEGNRCLRVNAGSFLTIDYETFGALKADPAASMSIELDLATLNATDTDAPLLRMCSAVSGKTVGFELLPWEARLLTAEKQDAGSQDIMFAEGERTHIVINIMNDIAASGINLARIFVNGVLNREISYADSDRFLQPVGGVLTSQGIRIGSDGADILIYGMRVYNKIITATDIQQNYMAALPTTEQKTAFREANDIMLNGLVHFTKVKDKYNTLVFNGEMPMYGNAIEPTMDVEVNIVGDSAHSGLLRHVKVKGQGTSSKEYWKWNQQMSFKDDDADSKFLALDSDGQPTVDMGQSYILCDGAPAAKKLVAKLNWASSQQSHKMGSVNLFSDLWRECMGDNVSLIAKELDTDDAKVRVSVVQKPFMAFCRRSPGADPEFCGLMTFGPGKGDKPTFGYDKKKFAGFMMLEGCDNGGKLTNHRIPWDDDVEVYEDIKNDKVEDVFVRLNGSKQWEMTMGDKRADNPSLDYFRSAFNFAYLHSTDIEPFPGTLAQLSAASGLDTDKYYWVTQSGAGAAAFDLFRCRDGEWVPAGIGRATLNLCDQLDGYIDSVLAVDSTAEIDSANEALKAARVAKFRAEAADYFNVPDMLFCMAFLLLIAASDNRAKNTYLYLDKDMKIRAAQDDLDTILTTDNVGKKDKPYYVETHDRKPGSTVYYWNGVGNNLYNLFEQAFGVELRQMMNTVLTKMAWLASANNVGNTPWDCFGLYYFSTQRYFPATAYNETARILYEGAAKAKAAGTYGNATDPLTQSLGDQLQCEMQWVKLRLIYISSYCNYGEFAHKGAGALSFRSKTTLSGHAANYNFVLTPHIWLYPAVSVGSTLIAPHHRVAAGEQYTLEASGDLDNDTTVMLLGVDNYRDIGDFGVHPIGGTFDFMGKHLTRFRATGNAGQVEFQPTAITFASAENLRELTLRNVRSLTTAIDLSGMPRVESIDIKDTTATGLTVGEPSVVRTLKLPGGFSSLMIVGYTNLTAANFSVASLADTTSLTIQRSPGIDTKAIVETWLTQNTDNTAALTLDAVDWTLPSAQLLVRIAQGVEEVSMRGRVRITSAVSADQLEALHEVFGADMSSEAPAGGLRVDILGGIAVLAPVSEAFPEGVNPVMYEHLVQVASANKMPGFTAAAATRGYITAEDLAAVTQFGDTVIEGASLSSPTTFHELQYFTRIPSTFGGYGYSFDRTPNITETTLPPQMQTVNKIGSSSSGLEVVVFPAGVSAIKYDSFSSLRYLREVWFFSETPPTCTITTSNVVPGASATGQKRIYVPRGCGAAYESAKGQWGFNSTWIVVEMI